MLSAVLVLASMIRLDSDAGSGAVMSVINREIMSARRIAIYDGDTSVFAPWYIALRGIEECARSLRYGSALSVLVLQPEVDSNEWAADGWFADWLQRSTRVTDIVGNSATAASWCSSRKRAAPAPSWSSAASHRAAFRSPQASPPTAPMRRPGEISSRSRRHALPCRRDQPGALPRKQRAYGANICTRLARAVSHLPDHRNHGVRLGEALQLRLARIAELDVARALDEIFEQRRYKDLAAARLARDA